MKTLTSLIVAAALMASAPVLGHHSFSMFDLTKRVTITGVVTEIQWANPHVWVFVDVPGAGGAPPARWGIEYTSVNHLTRVVGMTRNTIKVGETIEFQINPYADGTPGGRFQIMKLPNGRYYCDVGAVQQFCAQNNK